MSNKVFANIKRLSSEQNITIQKLEKMCNLGNGTIAKWENGNPTIGNIEKVAKQLECTVEDLFKEV